MIRSRRPTEASLRFAERRRREDAAPRLHERAPDLQSLRLEINDSGAAAKHIRLIVVDRAPALFLFSCSDPACNGGGYDVTDSIMRHINAHDAAFEAEDRCYGTIGSATCGRTLQVHATAQYRTE